MTALSLGNILDLLQESLDCFGDSASMREQDERAGLGELQWVWVFRLSTTHSSLYLGNVVLEETTRINFDSQIFLDNEPELDSAKSQTPKLRIKIDSVCVQKYSTKIFNK